MLSAFTMRHTGERGNKAQPQLALLLGQPTTYKPFEIWIKKNIPEVPSDLQAVPVRGHMVDGVHVLPVNVFLKTLLNNSYSHH